MPAGPNLSLVFSRALGKVIVDVHGVVDGYSAPDLKARLVDIIDGQGNRQLVLDLRGMSLIDEAGFAVLVDAQRRMRKIGGELVLSGATADVAQAFRLAGLDRVFVMTPAWNHPAQGRFSTSHVPLDWANNWANNRANNRANNWANDGTNDWSNQG
ncbi:MAG TPA: STAS domain-containing protein [Acidimicrobiales bacterium]|nr:STAS domain-containing protein [Acidimicrobiales bacterium]